MSKVNWEIGTHFMNRVEIHDKHWAEPRGILQLLASCQSNEVRVRVTDAKKLCELQREDSELAAKAFEKVTHLSFILQPGVENIQEVSWDAMKHLQHLEVHLVQGQHDDVDGGEWDEQRARNDKAATGRRTLASVRSMCISVDEGRRTMIWHFAKLLHVPKLVQLKSNITTMTAVSLLSEPNIEVFHVDAWSSIGIQLPKIMKRLPHLRHLITTRCMLLQDDEDKKVLKDIVAVGHTIDKISIMKGGSVSSALLHACTQLELHTDCQLSEITEDIDFHKVRVCCHGGSCFRFLVGRWHKTTSDALRHLASQFQGAEPRKLSFELELEPEQPNRLLLIADALEAANIQVKTCRIVDAVDGDPMAWFDRQLPAIAKIRQAVGTVVYTMRVHPAISLDALFRAYRNACAPQPQPLHPLHLVAGVVTSELQSWLSAHEYIDPAGAREMLDLLMNLTNISDPVYGTYIHVRPDGLDLSENDQFFWGRMQCDILAICTAP